MLRVGRVVYKRKCASKVASEVPQVFFLPRDTSQGSFPRSTHVKLGRYLVTSKPAKPNFYVCQATYITLEVVDMTKSLHIQNSLLNIVFKVLRSHYQRSKHYV